MTFWANKRVVVTGGGGFLGSHVVQLLRARGVKDDARDDRFTPPGTLP
jgi:nucleoside-diphosphate-sugar epimerase